MEREDSGAGVDSSSSSPFRMARKRAVDSSFNGSEKMDLVMWPPAIWLILAQEGDINPILQQAIYDFTHLNFLRGSLE
jgi:hypothetical protein